MQPVVGSIAISKSGRIRGNVVIICEKDGYYYVADGKTCTAENPKKKNPKHLVVTKVHAESVAQKLLKGMKVGRKTIKAALKSYEIKTGGNCSCQKTMS